MEINGVIQPPRVIFRISFNERAKRVKNDNYDEGFGYVGVAILD